MATVTTLISSSDLAGPLIPSASLAMVQDPEVLRRRFQPDRDELRARSAPTGRAAKCISRMARRHCPMQNPQEAPDHLAMSTEPANIVLIADTDLLTDRLWAQVQNFFGQRLTTALRR